MEDGRLFAKPTFNGDRFDGGVIPVDVLRELTLYKDLVLEVARLLFRARHPERQRLPKGFEDSFQIILGNVRDGSALAELYRRPQPAPAQLPGMQDEDLFEVARDTVESCVRSVADGAGVPEGFPRRALHLFGRFGKTLAPNESVELRGANGAAGPAYTQEVRRFLMREASSGYEDLIRVQAPVFRVDSRTDRFAAMIDGREVSGPMSATTRDFFFGAARAFKLGAIVELAAVGRFDADDRLREFVSVEDATLVEGNEPPLWNSQLIEIEKLTDGWLDGEGRAPSAEAISWMADHLSRLNEQGVPVPHIYPTPGGGIQLEWGLGRWDVDAEYDFAAETIEAVAVEIEGSGEHTVSYPLGHDEIGVFVSSFVRQ